MAVGRPSWSGREGTWDHRSEFVGADGRRPVGRLGAVSDDRCSFGTKSLSSLVPQLCAAPALAFAQVNASDLAPFDLDTRGMGRFGEGIQAPLRRTFFLSCLQRSIRIPLQLPRGRLLHQGEN